MPDRCKHCGRMLSPPGVHLYRVQRKIFNFLKNRKRPVTVDRVYQCLYNDKFRSREAVKSHMVHLRRQLKDSPWTITRAPYLLVFSLLPKQPGRVVPPPLLKRTSELP